MGETPEVYLFLMPEDEEIFVASIAVVQSLEVEVRKREIVPQFMFFNRCPAADFLLGVFPGVQHWAPYSGVLVDDFDLVFDFDVNRARRVVSFVPRHVTQAFGLLLGGDPVSIPDLSRIFDNSASSPHDVLFLPGPWVDTLVRWTETNHPECSKILRSGEATSLQELWHLVQTVDLVVGARSAATYLAAAAGAAVVEVYSPVEHRAWLSKWASEGYCMVYEDPGTVKPALIWRAMEEAWRRFRNNRSVGKSTPTVPSTSSAETAAS